jgi:hypothetical protein
MNSLLEARHPEGLAGKIPVNDQGRQLVRIPAIFTREH